MTITRIQVQGRVVDVAATRDEVRITPRVADGSGFSLWPPDGRWRVDDSRAEPTAAGSFALRVEPGRTVVRRRVTD